LAAGAWRVAVHRSNSQEKTLTDTSSVAVAATAVTAALIANGDRALGGHDRGYGQETQQESHDG
jgi:hypothetical protein